MNQHRDVIVAIDTVGPGGSAWAWLIPAGASAVLLDELAPLEGIVSVIGLDDSCTLHGQATLPSTSFTITLNPGESGPEDFRVRLVRGAPLIGPAKVDYFGGCSG